jgi:putative phage-type endonuclease
MDTSWATPRAVDDFHERRKNTIGSSDIPIILGLSPYKTPLDLWKVKTGLVQPEEQNFVQARGTEMEPIARDWYNKTFRKNFQPRLFTHTEVLSFTASLDGYDEHNNEAIEVKFNGDKNHDLAKQGIIPEYYLAQIHWQYIVSKASKIYYISYRDESPIVIDVPKPSEEMQTRLIHAAAEFLDKVITKIEPELTERDYLESDNKHDLDLANNYEYVVSVLDNYKREAEQMREKILKRAQEIGHSRIKIGNVKIIKLHTGGYSVRVK